MKYAICESKFWDSNLTWYTDTPDFTECFKDTALVWVPCSFLWLLLVIEVRWLCRSTKHFIPWTYLNILKMIISIFLISISMSHFFFQLINGEYNAAKTLASVLKCATYVLALSLVLIGRQKGVQNSYVQTLFWLIFFMANTLVTWSAAISFYQQDPRFDTFIAALIWLEWLLSFVMLVLSSLNDKAPEYKSPSKRMLMNPSPESSAPLISKLLFCYLNGLIIREFKTPVGSSDIYDLPDHLRSDYTCSKLENSWIAKEDMKRSVVQSKIEQHVDAPKDFKTIARFDDYESRNTTQEINIIRAIATTFFSKYIWYFLLRFVAENISLVNSFVIKLLIEFVSSDEPTWKGVLYATLLMTIQLTKIIVVHYCIHKMMQLSFQLRSSVMTCLFKKVLRISSSSKRTLTTGFILNAMSVDTNQFQSLCLKFHNIISAPVVVILTVYLLWSILGVSAFVGVAFILLLIPVNTTLVKFRKTQQEKRMRYSDKRIKMTSEVLTGIRVLKQYGWDKPYQERILKIRKQEVKVLRKLAIFNALASATWLLVPIMVSMATFSVFTALNGPAALTATKAFVSLSLLGVLKQMLQRVPDVITLLLMTYVSLCRIKKVLNSQEQESYARNSSVTEPTKCSPEAVKICRASFSWDWEDTAIIRDINMSVEKGSLVALVGSVGSGKSSILSAILEEMKILSGTLEVQGTIAYVSQQPWIQNTTLKENVLFGSAMDSHKYETIIKACALDTDISILPALDETEIGEKGINLSGGQKQRVSLARAVYMDRDVYLMDDPLGAVDSHTGKHIFEKIIGPNGLLRNKTRILITHNTTCLSAVDRIYIAENGTISDKGSFEDIISSGGLLKEYIQTQLGENDETTTTEKNVKTLNGYQNDIRGIKPQEGKRIMTKESTKENSSSRSLYYLYMKAVGIPWSIVVLVLFGIHQTASMSSLYWLALWTGDSERDANTTTNNFQIHSRLPVYVVLGSSEILLLLGTIVFLNIGALRAALVMHLKLLVKVLLSPVSFFDTTPIGRIINRFSRDVEEIDIIFPEKLQGLFINAFQVFALAVASSMAVPTFILGFIFFALISYFIQKLYLRTNNQLKRISSARHSPIFSHFSEALGGASIIRSSNNQDIFINKAKNLIDDYHSAHYLVTLCKRWIGVRIQSCGSLVMFFTALSCVLTRDSMSPGTVGFVLNNILNMVNVIFMLMDNFAEVETSVVSIDRISEYFGLNPEADNYRPEYGLKDCWPQHGKIEFERYSTRYRKGLDLVLDNVSFVVESQEKVAVVGRTGAGKSSLTLALFRIIEAAHGRIVIDGVDISKIGLHDLRTRVTIIPQDPVLFSGTLRMNLDPFQRHTEGDLWLALEQSHLKKFVLSFDKGLSFIVAEGGDNLSVGQRQLICLARALLRKTKILVMDEATASVDQDTDRLIQESIRREFKHCTILTIAHRLNTIIDYDRVLVLDQGCVTEYDKPSNLLQDTSSMFYDLAKDAGLVK